MTVDDLKIEIDQIKARNKKVEADKAWETSWTRKLVILALTYIVIVIFFLVTGLDKPFVNPIVPTIGFFLSTLSASLVKRYWIKNR